MSNEFNEYIEEYNVFLTGEISAVETYNLALKTAADAQIKDPLVKCRDSHLGRVQKLTKQVLDLSGTPALSSGVWGPFAAFCQGTASSEMDAIALLEQSEAERLVQYEAQQKLLPSPVLEFLTNDLLPEQHETHLTVSTLLKSLLPVGNA